MTWMLTANGGHFDLWLANPDSDISVLEIAASLAKINRWNGHTTRLYSVAEHSLHTSVLMEREHGITNPEALLCGLMHDAHEAYTADLIRPAKEVINALGRDAWRRWENRVQQQVLQRFGLDAAMVQWHRAVKRADDAMLATEARDVMPASERMRQAIGAISEPALSIQLGNYDRLSWIEWRDLFVERFGELREQARGTR